MKSKLLSLFLGLVLIPYSWALTALDQPTLEAALNTMADITALAEQHPEWENQGEEQDFFADDGSGFVGHLKSVGAYDEINKIAKEHGFSNIEEGFDVFRRAMLAGMTLQFEAMGMDFQTLTTSITQRMAAMQQNGASAEMLAEQQAQLDEFNSMAAAMSSISDNDKAAMKQHASWFFQTLEQMGLEGAQ
ncbi:hypothetical protein K0504_12970 [Neiella marina]|uniref:Uncharacterized protein n=1 Tax=Neiella holothuriorum TaxID=2870530 RepID=A0ABS7EJK9_9GAMM|nr:hypothetical protein [Neiella holothuriorum]MBW8191951.1 hypothetical protein [Neiella holothuriorum]